MLHSKIESRLHRSAKTLIDAGTDTIIDDSKPVKANTRHDNPKNPKCDSLFSCP